MIAGGSLRGSLCVCLVAGGLIAGVPAAAAPSSSTGFCAKWPQNDPRFPDKVALVVGDQVIDRGAKVAVRLWNGSGERISYGASILRQRFDGSRWLADPPFGDDQPPAIARLLHPGAATPCLRSEVSADAAPGHYRFVKRVRVVVHGEYRQRKLVARFAVR